MTSADETIEMLTPERRKEIERIAMKASQLYCNDTVAGEAVVAIRDLLTELTRLTEKCKALEMTEEKARGILSKLTTNKIEDVDWHFYTGEYTPTELRAIARMIEIWERGTPSPS